MRNTEKIVQKRACCGCGACTVVCKEAAISMVYGERFNYIKVDAKRCADCGRCLAVCPSSSLVRDSMTGTPLDGMSDENEHWLVHATDGSVRHDAASGGFTTALILHMLETGSCDGAIVARTSGVDPLRSDSIVARTRQEVLDARGSRYAPVSPCAALDRIRRDGGRYVFVGCPCHVEALTRLCRLEPTLAESIVLTIGFICAGTASRSSTRSYLRRYGVNVGAVKCIRYRGSGWPGSFTATGEAGEVVLRRPLLRYENGRVEGDELRYLVAVDHYLRCYNCLDHWGRNADVSVSDPWCSEMLTSETEGRSAIVVRTQRGRNAVAGARRDGVLTAEPIRMADHLDYQKDLVALCEETRRSWIPAYRAIFLGRWRGFPFRRPHGMRTTLRARLNPHYYERPRFCS